MNCTIHIHNPISTICIASHNCKFQRKLCVDCFYDHDVDVKQTVPINKFKEMAIKKLKESKLEQTFEITKQRMAFKQMISKTETMLQKIWQDLSESIKKTYDWIEQENKQFTNLISENTNLAQSSYSDIDKLVTIVQGSTLKDWNIKQNSYLKMLEKTFEKVELWNENFCIKIYDEIQEIQSLKELKEEEFREKVQNEVADLEPGIMSWSEFQESQKETLALWQELSRPDNFFIKHNKPQPNYRDHNRINIFKNLAKQK